uniref:Uncharacterized protein n=1 Tax=Glossina brevipalpis TaxID=37001 RepID=A0A1A9X0S4_9MUSC
MQSIVKLSLLILTLQLFMLSLLILQQLTQGIGKENIEVRIRRDKHRPKEASKKQLNAKEYMKVRINRYKHRPREKTKRQLNAKDYTKVRITRASTGHEMKHEKTIDC